MDYKYLKPSNFLPIYAIVGLPLYLFSMPKLQNEIDDILSLFSDDAGKVGAVDLSYSESESESEYFLLETSEDKVFIVSNTDRLTYVSDASSGSEVISCSTVSKHEENGLVRFLSRRNFITF